MRMGERAREEVEIDFSHNYQPTALSCYDGGGGGEAMNVVVVPHNNKVPVSLSRVARFQKTKKPKKLSNGLTI